MTFCRRVETPAQVHQGRFARARRTDDGQVLTLFDPAGDAAQRMELLGSHLVRPPDVLHIDQRLHGRCGTITARLSYLRLAFHKSIHVPWSLVLCRLSFVISPLSLVLCRSG